MLSAVKPVPRPRSLSSLQIAAAALTVVDREGLTALTMRSVANELGMAAMSLYRYVDSREQLEGLVVDLVLGAIDLRLPARARWGTRLSLLAERARAVIASHPAIVPLCLTRRHSSLGSVRWGEAVLATLADAGFDGQQRAIALRTLLSYVLGAAQVEHFGALSGRGTEQLAELPRSEFPHLAETARIAARIPPLEEFRRGLAVVIRGLEALRT